MAKLTKIDNAAIASAVATAPTNAKLDLKTLPLETFLVIHSVTENNKPKIILKALVNNENKGTIQLFANTPAQQQELFETFEDGDVIDGTENQGAIYFTASNGSNFHFVSIETATRMMEKTGLNSTPMAFGPKVNNNSIADVKVAKAINRGNVGQAAVATEGGAIGWITSTAKNLLG